MGWVSLHDTLLFAVMLLRMYKKLSYSSLMNLGFTFFREGLGYKIILQCQEVPPHPTTKYFSMEISPHKKCLVLLPNNKCYV